ncbi:Uncharacterized protein (Fragment) [Durusdinium trenchii]|uniref:Uncharacterized protein n=1 Tax=Durusdinium trenchii TaxID=1381693 RepID=A0ABP0SQC0_9DINO
MKANIANALKASGISKPEPPVIKSEPFVPVKVKTEPVELPVVACAGGASASSGQAPLLPSSNNAVGGGGAFGSGGTQDEAGILTHHFVPLADTAEQPGQQQQKDLFLAADLVIPGIALKKMKQALTAANEASKHFFGVMAPATGKMYRKEKPSVQKLVIANMQLHGQVFWQRVVKHFAGNELSVFLEALSKLQEKENELTQKLALFNQVLAQMTAPNSNRPEKSEDDTWIDHFKLLVGSDIPEAPATFQNSSLSYQEVLIRLAQHIGFITTALQKAKNGHARAVQKKLIKEKHLAKKEQRLKRKVEETFGENAELERKKMKSKQRRRQQYFAKKKSKAKAKTLKRRARQYKTIDNGEFPQPLRAPRRVITIEKKLSVLDRWEELVEQKKKAQEAAQEPRPVGVPRAKMKEWKAAVKEAKKKSRLALLKTIRHEFPDIVGGCQPFKWKKTAEREGWRHLPQFIQARCSATANEWRSRLSLAKKGRSIGGAVPHCIQRELDLLIMEHSSGPIAFCVAEGHISGQDIVDYNLKNYGRSMVVTSGGSSHFMTGETMMIMMEQLISPALKLQRERHGLSDQDRAALLCDAWTGFEDLDIKASGQIAASVQNMRRVLELSLQAWNSIPIRVFQASWIVTGYFESSHFPPIDQTPSDIGAAQKVLDPAGVSGGSLPGTPQFCHKYEWQVQDEDTPDEWHGLPYEIAHAIVRCVTMHGKAFLDAKRELHAQKQVDLSGKKPKTLKLKSAFEALHESKRYSVMNRRTGWVATSEWLNTHVKVAEDGKPHPKKEKGKLWILTIHIKIVGPNIDVRFSPSDGKPFRAVRCLSLEGGAVNAKLTSIVSGYEHLLTDDDDAEAHLI